MATRIPLRQLQGAGGRFTKKNQGILWTGLEVLADNINKRGNSLNASRKKSMEKLAEQMEAYAKRNARWRDRTGDARARLHGVAVHNDRQQTSTAYLGHGVGYGVFLETMQGGSFAIIMPTIQVFGAKMFATVKEYDTLDDVADRMEAMGE